MIALLDVLSTFHSKAWSSIMRRIHFALNYNNLPYKTQWIEYPEIAPVLKATRFPYYSVPAILDNGDNMGEVKVAMAKSYDIAKYLDGAYPGTPRLFPDESEGQIVIKEFVDGFVEIARSPGLRLISSKAVLARLNPASQVHFSRVRARNL
ncbi:hypothetical protein MD484_g4526, partial [Candolleomyces efflorescens]